jgi:hypothetical protein
MITEFAPLSEEEKELMFDALPLIAVLVAGADGKMDNEEIKWAEKMADIRSFDNHGRIAAYYEIVDERILDRIAELRKELPADIDERQQLINQRLAGLNAALAKLDSPFDYLYYRDFISYAKHLAEVSGGFLSYFSVGPEEEQAIQLPTVDPIEKPEEPKGFTL